MTQPGLFDVHNRLESLSKAGDPLVLLKEKIDWTKFNGTLLLATSRERKSSAGRKPFPALLMFKILILQSLYNLSDEQMEFQIRDRLSFMRFLGLNFEDRVPDQKTIWHYREVFTETGTVKTLFNKFNAMLDKMGLMASKGTLIDASIIEVPRQRNTRDENQQIKNGETPVEWKENPAKLCQKDVDARWVTKHGEDSFGYKMHVNADNKYKIIRKIEVTPASTHDSQIFEDLLTKNTSGDVWADSAYYHKRNNLPDGYREHIHRKGKRGTPLTDFQKKKNTERSIVRCRVEHVFGHIKGRMKLFIRTVGLVRAETKIVLSSLAYNMARCVRIA